MAAGPLSRTPVAGSRALSWPTPTCRMCVPVLLGAGLRLFEGLGPGRRDLEPLRVVATPLATHLKYRFARG
ncbi:hypothetical protein ACGFW6_12470 [Streptomyces sp. Y7]